MRAMADASLAALSAFGAELVERGLVMGSGGNLSLRVDDVIHITRSGALLHQLTPADFVSLPMEAPFPPPVSPSPRPSTETPMHLAAYRARPEARVVIHCHPLHAIAWAMQGRDLPACTPDFVLYLGAAAPLLPYALPGSAHLAELVARGLAGHPVLLLGNHGLLVTGPDLRVARLRTLHIEETAHICLLAAAAGQLRPLQPAEIAEILATYGP